MRRRLDQMMMHLRAKVEVSCSEYEGIDAVRAALERGTTASTRDCHLRIRLISHPLFIIDCRCYKRRDGVNTIDRSVELIKRSIQTSGGYFGLRSHPDVTDWELEDSDEEEGMDDELQ